MISDQQKHPIRIPLTLAKHDGMDMNEHLCRFKGFSPKIGHPLKNNHMFTESQIIQSAIEAKLK